MTSKPLRVGFDLDGVLLYNPARIARMPISIFKRLFLKKKELKFYYPKSRFEKGMWRAFHWTSMFIAPGFDEVKNLAKSGKIEAYIVTARYSFLKSDFEKWLKKMEINHIFKGIYQNTADEQPHLFKERMIKKLKLDIFVEDNKDIVDHLNKNTATQIFWIFNILDYFIIYERKFPMLDKVINYINRISLTKNKSD